jgi:hypothetical protein
MDAGGLPLPFNHRNSCTYQGDIQQGTKHQQRRIPPRLTAQAVRMRTTNSRAGLTSPSSRQMPRTGPTNRAPPPPGTQWDPRTARTRGATCAPSPHPRDALQQDGLGGYSQTDYCADRRSHPAHAEAGHRRWRTLSTRCVPVVKSRETVVIRPSAGGGLLVRQTCHRVQAAVLEQLPGSGCQPALWCRLWFGSPVDSGSHAKRPVGCSRVANVQRAGYLPDPLDVRAESAEQPPDGLRLHHDVATWAHPVPQYIAGATR